MAEGWLKHHAAENDLEVEVFSAGTEKTFVKPDAVTVMREVGIDLSSYTSKTFRRAAGHVEFRCGVDRL